MKEQYKPTKFAKELQSLVKIPSVSGHEKSAQTHLFDELEMFGSSLPKDSGFSLKLQEVESYDSPNLVAHMPGNRGKGAKKALILTGHIDTVSPAGCPSEWVGKSPWSGEITEQLDGTHALYGVGSSDMKIGLKVLQHVFQSLAQKDTVDCDVWFVSAINEEKNGAGTAAFAKWFHEQGFLQKYPDGIAAIFGEPRGLGSEKTTLGIGNKANDFLIAEKTRGSRHSSEIGPNVADDLITFGKAVGDLDAQFQTQAVEEGFTPPHVTITKLITPNENLNSTAASGSVSLDLRTTPATQQSSYEQVIGLAKSLGFDITHADIAAPGSYTHPDSPIVKAFQDVLMQEGVEVKLATTPGSTDAGFLQEIGINQNIIAGAGTEEQEHTLNEHAILEEGERAVGLTTLAALKWMEIQGNHEENLSIITPEIGKMQVREDVDFFVILSYDGPFAVSRISESLSKKTGKPEEELQKTLELIYSDMFLPGLELLFHESFSPAFQNFQIHLLNRSGELDKTISQIAKQRQEEGFVVVNLHPTFEEEFTHNLKTTRMFYLGGEKLCKQGHRPGSLPLTNQLVELSQSLQGKSVVLLEDDTHSGQTLRATKKQLEEQGIYVEEVLLGTQVHNPGVNQVDLNLFPLMDYILTGNDIYTTNDFLDMKDALWGATGGGYGIILPSGEHVRAPLGLPFTSPTARLSIPKEKETEFSKSLLQLNKTFYEKAQEMLGVTITLKDVSPDFSKFILYFLGDVSRFSDQTPILEVIKYVDVNAEALQTIIKTVGFLQQQEERI